jgi:hypothetical protein
MRVGQWWQLVGLVLAAVGLTLAPSPWAMVAMGAFMVFAGGAWCRAATREEEAAADARSE